MEITNYPRSGESIANLLNLFTVSCVMVQHYQSDKQLFLFTSAEIVKKKQLIQMNKQRVKKNGCWNSASLYCSLLWVMHMELASNFLDIEMFI